MTALARLRSIRFAGDPRLDACLSGAATLQRGLQGPAVAKVQQALMDLGYSLRDFGPDGVFGRETEDAVAAFNADVAAGGDERVVGSRAMAALDDRFAGEQPEDLPRRTASRPPRPPERPPSGCARRAAELALGQAEDGAHFLAGAAGATPGGEEGTLLRPAGVTLAPGRTDPVMPAVFAARCELDGPQVCCGRFNARNGGIAGGRPATANDTDLIVYLARLAALPEHEWTPFFGFFSPRRGDGAGFGQRLVWGEDCRAKRHFDGVGLVNWCLEQALGTRQPIDFDMDGWATDASGTEAVALSEPPRTGDLVLRATAGRFTHIGFLVAGPPRVVLAEQPAVGVVVRRFSPAGWTVRRRPLD